VQKQLRESTDAMEQTLLMKQIMDLQRLIEMQEQQIANIQQAEKRKQEAARQDQRYQGRVICSGRTSRRRLRMVYASAVADS
jgi:Tfp pilus assembly protein PilN